MSISVDQEKCTQCEACVTTCSRGAIQLASDTVVIDQEICTGCGDCIPVCPSEAIFEDDKVITIIPTPAPLDKPNNIPASEQQSAQPVSTWSGVVLPFLLQEIAPRLMNILERRLSSPLDTSTRSHPLGTNGRICSPQPTGWAKRTQSPAAYRRRRRARGNRFESYTERR